MGAANDGNTVDGAAVGCPKLELFDPKLKELVVVTGVGAALLLPKTSG